MAIWRRSAYARISGDKGRGARQSGAGNLGKVSGHAGYQPGIRLQTPTGLNDALFLRHNPAQARQYEQELYRSLIPATLELSVWHNKTAGRESPASRSVDSTQKLLSVVIIVVVATVAV